MKSMMKNKIPLIILIPLFLLACNSSRQEYVKMKQISEKITEAVCNSRERENYLQYTEMLEKSNCINEYSDAILETLTKNEYKEADIHRLFAVEIEKIYFQEILNRSWDLVGTSFITYKIDGIKYTPHYLIDYDEGDPNIYTLVFVYSNDKKTDIRVFYKVNYNLEYYRLTNGDKEFNVFF